MITLANLYKIRDSAMDEFFVLADDDISASVAYKDWVEDPENGLDSLERLPVQEVNLLGSQDPAQSLSPGRVTLIFGPMS